MLLLTIEPREQGVSQREFGVPPLDQPRRELGVPLDQPRREFGVPPTALVPRDGVQAEERWPKEAGQLEIREESAAEVPRCDGCAAQLRIWPKSEKWGCRCG